MPAKKGRLKELEGKNEKLTRLSEDAEKIIIGLIKTIKAASPLEWIRNRNYQAAGEWEEKVKSHKREEKGE